MGRHRSYVCHCKQRTSSPPCLCLEALMPLAIQDATRWWDGTYEMPGGWSWEWEWWYWYSLLLPRFRIGRGQWVNVVPTSHNLHLNHWTDWDTGQTTSAFNSLNQRRDAGNQILLQYVREVHHDIRRSWQVHWGDILLHSIGYDDEEE
jgi:hypothetical protein